MSPTDADHRETTRREFAKQAPSFEAPGSIFRDRGLLDWIGEHVPVDAADLVLDVAGGNGQLGRYLAERAAFAVVVDLTREMLETGAASAAGAGTRNVLFTEGDATDLPFPDSQFDLVVSRFAFHHFDDPAVAAREMARVCRPGGKVAVIDMVAEDPADAARRDELERLRDPSHTRALAAKELASLPAEAGISAEIVAERRRTLDATAWVEQGQPPEPAAAEVLKALGEEADGGAATGLRARREDGGLVIEHLYVIAAGRRS
ncbi:MAG TPA: methyltransferase domain-containing protein [Solirubrobacterales bacterium]|jgi:SAM-dependent methyltransferase